MTKQETLTKGVGVAKFDLTKHLEINYFHVLGYYIINTRLHITVKVFYSPKS